MSVGGGPHAHRAGLPYNAMAGADVERPPRRHRCLTRGATWHPAVRGVNFDPARPRILLAGPVAVQAFHAGSE